MMPIAPTAGSTRNPSSHTETEILAALRGHLGSRRWSFRYEHLEPDGSWIRDLTQVTSGEVTQNWLADVKRTAKFSMAETGGIDFLADRIRPVVRLHLPPYGADNWVEWPQGVFLLSTTKRGSTAAGQILRDVEGYDQLQVYADDAVDTRYTVAAGANVITSVTTLLNSVLVPPSIVSTPHSGTLTTAKEWPPGTTKLKMINELLGMVNYESLSFDEDGRALVRPYRSPTERAPEYTYADDQHGLVVPAVDQELDLFNIPNKWVLVVSEPELDTPLTSTYTNTDPASPTSTVRRQRTITDYREEQEAVDQTTLNGKVARLAFEASQVYEAIPFATALMPVHSGNDVYRLVHGPLAINAIYAEHSWKMTMKAGVPMEHVARRVVTV